MTGPSAGIPVLAGTDTNYPGPQLTGTLLAASGHGITLHHELALLVRAGLSPAEALATTTSVPARLFGLTDRGRIARGLRAEAQDRLPEALAALELLGQLIIPEIYRLASEPANTA